MCAITIIPGLRFRNNVGSLMEVVAPIDQRPGNWWCKCAPTVIGEWWYSESCIRSGLVKEEGVLNDNRSRL